MARTSFVILVSLFGTMIGCFGGGGTGSGGTPGVTPQSAEISYAQAIGHQVLAVRDALQSEGGVSTAQGILESLLEGLEGYESKGGTANKEAFSKVESVALEVKKLCDAKAGKAEVQSRVEELVAAAEKLPGTGSEPASKQ